MYVSIRSLHEFLRWMSFHSGGWGQWWWISFHLTVESIIIASEAAFILYSSPTHLLVLVLIINDNLKFTHDADPK
jgi:hypothetical protein